MKCFARWREEDPELCFRDQTILQFGEDWELLVNYILLNPGSALPVDRKSQNEYLESKELPYYVAGEGEYYSFSIDRLMNDLLKLYSSKYSGGVIKIYNLFNLKNQNSGTAIEQYKKYRKSKLIHTNIEDIKYCYAPVIIATGSGVHADPGLEEELKKFISLAEASSLYSLQKKEDKVFCIEKAHPDESGLIDSYHPSYTFKYGNTTILK
ncbi:MAG TPA: hypothetical protein ENJ28_09170 [Gammaproteobacteria bacterium]|nr:hypothetical protein [Gammaproteobacteria bacterium]